MTMTLDRAAWKRFTFIASGVSLTNGNGERMWEKEYKVAKTFKSSTNKK